MRRFSDDTICASATADGIGGISVIRVSGSRAFELCDAVLRHRQGCRRYRGFTIHRADVVDAQEVVDDVLVSVFHAPRSFTGEDVVEISCHGGHIPVSHTLRLLIRAGCRSANPGEFTQRAFFNGKLDLAQAEAVCDLINARTDEAYRQAQNQKKGQLSQAIEDIRYQLLAILARVEASIDFSEDVGELDVRDCIDDLTRIESDLVKLLNSADRGILLRKGAVAVLVGRTNVGKSSLMNRLLRHDRAIVTDVAGTTRDTIEESLNIKGVTVRLWDTAGLRETDDPVEAIGVVRTRSAMGSADLVILVVDSTVGLTEEDRKICESIESSRLLIVWNKSDLARAGELQVSATLGHGLDELEDEISRRLGGDDAGESTSASVTHAHQRTAVEAALLSVRNAMSTAANELPADFLSVDIRLALSSVSEITGQTATEDIINEIFSKFCIGK